MSLQPIQRVLDVAQESCKMLMPIHGYEILSFVSLEEAVEPLIAFLPDIRDYANLAKQRCENSPFDSLSLDESASIILLSMEWEPYDECLYSVLNTALRTEDRRILRPWFLYLKLVLAALSRFPSSDQVIYRGSKLNLKEQYPVGETIFWCGFSSCVSNIELLENEQYLGKTGTRTMFTIECFSSKNIRRYCYCESKDELLLIPGRQFKVVSYYESTPNLHMVQLKEIESPFPFLQPVSDIISNWNNFSPVTTPSSSSSSNYYRNDNLEELIAKCPINSEVILKKQGLTDRDIPIVVEKAVIRKQCTELWLKGNAITSKGTSILANALRSSTSLKELYLYGNHVSDMGARSLAQALAVENSTLTRLSLGSNEITDKGALHLAKMLKTNRTLTHLLLSNNRIGDKGCLWLADVLIHDNNSLERLDLDSNQCANDSIVTILISLIKFSQSLQGLNVSDCNLSASSKAQLRKAKKLKEGFTLWI